MAENSDDAYPCPVCCEDFSKSGDHLPRLLPCSHCICTKCVGEILRRKTLVCPQCRKKHRAQRGVASFPRNKDILANLKKSEQEEKAKLKAKLEQLKVKLDEKKNEDDALWEDIEEKFDICEEKIKAKKKTVLKVLLDMSKSIKLKRATAEKMMKENMQEIKESLSIMENMANLGSKTPTLGELKERYKIICDMEENFEKKLKSEKVYYCCEYVEGDVGTEQFCGKLRESEIHSNRSNSEDSTEAAPTPGPSTSGGSSWHRWLGWLGGSGNATDGAKIQAVPRGLGIATNGVKNEAIAGGSGIATNGTKNEALPRGLGIATNDTTMAIPDLWSIRGIATKYAEISKPTYTVTKCFTWPGYGANRCSHVHDFTVLPDGSFVMCTYDSVQFVLSRVSRQGEVMQSVQLDFKPHGLTSVKLDGRTTVVVANQMLEFRDVRDLSTVVCSYFSPGQRYRVHSGSGSNLLCEDRVSNNIGSTKGNSIIFDCGGSDPVEKASFRFPADYGPIQRACIVSHLGMELIVTSFAANKDSGVGGGGLVAVSVETGRTAWECFTRESDKCVTFGDVCADRNGHLFVIIENSLRVYSVLDGRYLGVLIEQGEQDFRYPGLEWCEKTKSLIVDHQDGDFHVTEIKVTL